MPLIGGHKAGPGSLLASRLVCYRPLAPWNSHSYRDLQHSPNTLYFPARGLRQAVRVGGGVALIIIDHTLPSFQKVRAAVAIEAHRGRLPSLRDEIAQPEPSARPLGLPLHAGHRDTPPPRRRCRGTPHRKLGAKESLKEARKMPRPEGVLSMKARSLFARKHRRFVAISQGGLSTFKLQKPEDIAVLETRKDLPFDYVEGVRLDGSRFVVKRRKPWRSDVVFYCATAPAARAWAEALRSRLDAFRNKARVQFPPLNESLGPNVSPRPELPPYPPPSPARLKAGQVDVAG